jgi:RHS repeat-associated protein
MISRSNLITQSIIGGGSPVTVTQYLYDAADRLDCTAQRMNTATFASLPTACTLTLVASGLGPDRVSRNTYDASNRVTKVTRGYGSTNPIDEATLTYTANGKVATLVDGTGNLTTMVYDGFDRTSRMRYPNTGGGGSSTSDYQNYTYDAAGNVTVLRQRDAETLTNTYDNLNRVTQTAPSANGPTIQFTYDLLNRKLTQSHASGQTLTFTYDALNRNLTQQSSVLGTVTYQYDAASRRTRMDWPDGFYVTYDLDLYNAVTAIRENGAASGAGVLATYTYDGLGRRTLLTRGNGTTQTPSYDSAYNLSSLAQTATNTAFDETITFAHNPLGQSTTRTGSNTAYQWSPIAPATASYSRNGLNQYTAVAGTNYSYDARGNLTGDGTRTFAFDVYNRLTSVSGAGSMTLAYDPAGRLYETATATTTRFLYDGSTLIGEFNTSGTLLRRTVQGAAGEALVWYEGSGTTDRRYLMTNELGTVIAADAGSGVTVYSYDDYGNPNAWNSPGTAPRQRYAGTMMLAEAQLYHMGARAYAPGIGRFLQTDPILFDGGINLYAYVGNDPVNATDPSGFSKANPNDGCRASSDVCVKHARRNIEVLHDLQRDQGALRFDQISEDGAQQAKGPWPNVLPTPGFRYRIPIPMPTMPRLVPRPPLYPRPPGWTPQWRWGHPEGTNPHTKPRWFDPRGGEWRYHGPDKHHRDPHWDYNPWDQWNSRWRNVPMPSVPPVAPDDQPHSPNPYYPEMAA